MINPMMYPSDIFAYSGTLIADSVSGSEITVDSEGSIITRNSDGEEVIRIDRYGIHINGTIMISTGPTMIMRVETPEEHTGGGLGGLIKRLFRNNPRTQG
jgi:hypothetical protein